MTKVLLDPIYSAKPSHCSSALKCKKIVEHVLFELGRDDVFFRLMVPDTAPDSELAWFPQHPNLELVPHPLSKDRMIEYRRYTRELEDKISFGGSFWDNDIVITMRTQQVPNIKVSLTSPRNYNQAYLKKVLLFEEMPIMTFKAKTVAVGDRTVQDLATLQGYLSADQTYITCLHEKEGIVSRAKDFFNPYRIKELGGKVQIASPVRIGDFGFSKKDPEHRFKKGSRPFCLGYSDRMNNVASRLDTVYDVMQRHWITKGDEKFEVFLSTVTTGIKKKPPEFVTVRHLPREEFWNAIKTKMDVALFLSMEGGFGMSFFEPLLFGTPMICMRDSWIEGLIGKDYPFFVDNMTEAYAAIKLFYDDYEAMYGRFYTWQQDVLKKRFEVDGVYQHNLYDLIGEQILTHTPEALSRFKEQSPSKENNSIVEMVLEEVGDRQEFNLLDVIDILGKKGKLEFLSKKLDKTVDDLGVVWMTPWNEYRTILKAFHGFEDASVKVGHLRRAA